MIRGFKDEETENVFRGEQSRKLPPNIQPAARRKLIVLDAAMGLQDLAAVPGNRLEKLQGDRAGQYSIRINEQWRVCFTWTRDNDAENVEIADYH